MITYEKNGRMTITYPGVVEYTVTGLPGKAIKVLRAGRSSFTYQVKDQQLRYTGVDSTETLDVYLDGQFIKGFELQPFMDPRTYTCQGDTLREESSNKTAYLTAERRTD